MLKKRSAQVDTVLFWNLLTVTRIREGVSLSLGSHFRREHSAQKWLEDKNNGGRGRSVLEEKVLNHPEEPLGLHEDTAAVEHAAYGVLSPSSSSSAAAAAAAVA